MLIPLLVCFFGNTFVTASNFQNCFLVPLDAVIKEERSLKNTTSHSLLDCALSNCICNGRCIVSFHTKTGACRTITLSAAPLSWTKRFIFNNRSDTSWESFIPVESLNTPSIFPEGFWMMDNSLRGLNIGSKGNRLDSTDGNLTWSRKGPLDTRTNLRYSHFISGETPQVQIRQSSAFVLDFTTAHTVAVWVKTDAVSALLPMLDGWNKPKNTYACHFWFYPSKNRDQLQWSANHFLLTTINGTDRLEWRHVAVTYAGGSQYTFYLNANPWPIWVTIVGTLDRVNPDVINFGHRDDSHLRGSMACISIFEKALTQAEIRTLMVNCP